VHRQLHELNCRVIARLDGRVNRQGDLWQAHGARLGVPGGAEDLEGRDHRVAHVGRPPFRSELGAVGAEAQVDVDEG
jgi:hypothetical protein